MNVITEHNQFGSTGTGLRRQMNQTTASSEREFVNAFRADIIDLFKRQKGGHTSRWTYTGRERPAHQPSGSQLWSDFVAAARNYYIPAAEIQLIQHSLPVLSQRFREADTLVDFGSGDRFAYANKVAPILGETPNISTYVPIDISEDLLEGVEHAAKADGSSRKVVSICSDFYKNRPKIVMPGQRRAGVMLGATISNMNMTEEQGFPENNIIEKIQALGNLLRKHSDGGPTVLALGYDSNQDLKGSALAAYDDVNWRRMIVGLMIDVKTVLNPEGDFDPFAWHYEGIPDVRNQVIHQCAVADRDQKFFIGNEPFYIGRGQRFVIVNNFKYSPVVLQDLIEKAGYKPDDVITMPDNPMAIQTMTIG